MSQQRICISDAEMAEMLRCSGVLTLRRAAERVSSWPRRGRQPTPWALLKPGQLLWVGENYTVTAFGQGTYKADGQPWSFTGNAFGAPAAVTAPGERYPKRRQSFAMPKEISRFTLKVVSCEVQGSDVLLKVEVHRCNWSEFNG